MLEGFKNIFKIPEIRKRIFFTVGALIVFRIGAQISLPGIDMAEIKAFFVELSKTKGGGGIFDFLNLFTGGALKQFAIFGLGVMPYISASIIMQLLQVVIPHLERLAKEGDFGRKKINMYTRYLSIVLCVVQGLGILIYFKSQILTEAINMGKVIITTPGQTIGLMFTFNFILILTAGTMFLLWLGEQITERGLGNGISLLIFAGIVARIPTVIYQTFTVTDVTQEAGAIRIIILLLIFVAFIALVAFMQQGERRVTVKYAKRVVGNKMYQGQNTYIPFKVDPAGVIAIIFASSVILFPSQILASFGSGSRIMVDIARLLSPGSILYYILYLILVIFFCYFYTAIMYNPQEIAEHVRKNGGFIPGIRPGEQTSLFLQKLLNRLILPGAIIVGFIAIAPNIVSDILGVPDEVAQILGGTSLLIMVGVALDTLKQVESQLRTRNLDGFMKTNKTRSRHY